jgi:hypothetical protein
MPAATRRAIGIVLALFAAFWWNAASAYTVTTNFQDIFSQKYQFDLSVFGGAIPEDNNQVLPDGLNSSTVIPALCGVTLVGGTYDCSDYYPTYPFCLSFNPPCELIGPSEGPGLVPPGVDFSSLVPGHTLFWEDGAGVISTHALVLGGGSGGELGIEFSVPVDAFSLGLASFTDDVPAADVLLQQQTVSVYGSDGTLLDSIVGPMTGDTSPPVFVGAKEPIDIGSIVVTGGDVFAPAISELTFDVVPEPSSLVLFGTALAALGLVCIGMRKPRHARSPPERHSCVGNA